MQEGLIDDMSIFGDINVINVFVADLISSLLMSYGELNTLQMCVCSCELPSSFVEKTIPYVSAPLWSVPLPFLSPTKNQ